MKRFARPWIAGLFALVAFFFASPARAHKPSDAYLTLTVDGAEVKGRLDLALRDVDYAIGLDEDENGEITWREVDARRLAIASLLRDRISLSSDDGGCSLDPSADGAAIATHSDGSYFVVPFTSRCSSRVRTLAIDYRLFFDVDRQHRGIVRVDAGGTSRTHVFSASAPSVRIALGEAGRLRQLATLIEAGVVHIWTGYDHVLFLLALLLPSVLRREGKRWEPVTALRPALVDVVRIVTSFTIAHSITLGLSALGIVSLSPRVVESAIAASVVLAAINNLYPLLREDRWLAAFALGLMHGFGFSSTLMDLDLPKTNFVVTLLGFNLGVEIGQLAIVAIFVPAAYLARKSVVYRRGAFVAGSLAILTVAAIWLVGRVFDVKALS